MVIDPVSAHRVIGRVREENVQIKYILNTHTHPDHVSGNAQVRKATDAAVLAHRKALVEKERLVMKIGSGMGLFFRVVSPDILVEDGEEICVGKLTFRILYTPGHTADGICVLGDRCVFTGDTLFADSVGRTDFPGASYRLLLKSIGEKLLVLPDETRVFPGHGEETTIGREREVNPFCIEALRG